MPKTQTPDQLRERAEKLAAEAADAQAALDAQTLREWEAEQEAQADRDRETIKNYNRAELDKAVDEALAEFKQALADLPVTKALARYIHAGYRRSWAYNDLSAARGRLGLPDGGGLGPSGAFVPPFEEAINQAATEQAQAAIDAERSQP